MMQKKFEKEKDKDTGMCVSKFFDYALNLMYMTRREHCSRSIAYLAANGDVFPCVSSAATDTFKAGNIRENAISPLGRFLRDMRAITWQHFIDETCHECPLNGPDYFCANRCPVMSLVLNGTVLGCGATEFEKADLELRTQRLRNEIDLRLLRVSKAVSAGMLGFRRHAGLQSARFAVFAVQDARMRRRPQISP